MNKAVIALKAAKVLTGLAATASSGMVVRKIIESAIPTDLSRFQSLAFKAGTFFISGAVGGIIGERLEKQFDDVIESLTKNEEVETPALPEEEDK